jgi:hypothetical protein
VLCVVSRVVNTWTSVIHLLEGAFGGILLMWDRKVVEKIEECVGSLQLAARF